MANNPSNKTTISGSSLFATLLVVLMGANFLDLPYSAVKYGGPSGYWCVGIAFLLIVPVILVAVALQRRFPNQNLLELAPAVIGKPLAFLGNLLFLSMFLIWQVFALRDGSDMIHIYLLNQTPLLAVLLILLICVGYVAVNGLAAVVRLISFLFIPSYGIRLLIEIFTFQTLRPTHLLPLFSESPGRYLMGGMSLVGYFLPVTAIFLLFRRLKQPSQAGKAAFGALGGIFPVYLLAFLGTVGSFGAEYTMTFSWSEVAATNHINIPFLIMEQMGLLFMIVWITTFFSTKALYFYILGSGLKNQFPRLNYRWTVIVLLVLVGCGAMLFPNSIVVREAFTWVRPWLMIPVSGYPFLVYLIAVIRRKRGYQGGT